MCNVQHNVLYCIALFYGSTYISVFDAGVSQLTFVLFHTGSVQYRGKLPVKIIVGACVGGGLFLIILLCITVAVLCRRKMSKQNHQQQALQQPQPSQQQKTHGKTGNTSEQAYIYDDLTPDNVIPSQAQADNGEYLQPVPMGQMASDGDYMDIEMAPRHGTSFSHLADNGEYLHMASPGEIPIGQIAGNGGYENVPPASKGDM